MRKFTILYFAIEEIQKSIFAHFFHRVRRHDGRNDAPHDSTCRHETFTECTRQMLTRFHEISTDQSHASRPDALAQLYDFVFCYIEITKKYFCALFLPGRRSGVLTRQMLARHSRIRRHPSKNSMKTRHAQLYDFVFCYIEFTKKYFCAFIFTRAPLQRFDTTNAHEIPRDSPTS